MSKVAGRQQDRQERRRREQRRRARSVQMKRLATPALWVAFALVVIGMIAFTAWRNIGVVNSAYASVSGVSCDDGEHANLADFHIHAHLTMYINGKQTPPPANIGINYADGTPCIYWLHTHNTDGIIHIEAPKGASYTLNTFLQIWSSRFPKLGYLSQLNSTQGWQAYVDGKPFTGDFHTIPLHAHTLITLAYNSPGIKPDTSFNWNGL